MSDVAGRWNCVRRPWRTKMDKKIAGLKLATMGIDIDKLTPEQEKYLASWEMGT